jgi:uncharacterized RDD family membrane protein YckC
MAGPVVEPAPEAARSDRPVLPEGLVFADAYSRFAAYLLDGVVLAALTSIPPALLGLYDYSSTTYPPPPTPRATFIGTTIFSIAIQAAYFLWFWTAGRRATPGQRVFDIQIGNAFDGRALTMTQAIIRWLAMGWWLEILVLLPFLSVAIGAYAATAIWFVVIALSIVLSPTKQGIHDRLARSALVRPAGPTNRWAIGCVWLYVGVALFGLLMLALTVYLFNAIDRSSIYPQGVDPIDIFSKQIREFWPY